MAIQPTNDNNNNNNDDDELMMKTKSTTITAKGNLKGYLRRISFEVVMGLIRKQVKDGLPKHTHKS
jgi:hypothetical protein